ncbi:MAG TPA: hypothetical protein VFB14_04400 [Bryobacteraceae bacterium]|nr:hypothetical protein [Bryobacteraceae bacterium]
MAHQTDIPQDGSTNLSDSALNNFLASAGQTPPNGPTQSWEKVLKQIAPLLFIARSVWANQNPQNPYAYPYPYLVDLVGDTETTPTGNVAERDRTYLLEDTYGHAWVPYNPVTISEKFVYVGGSQSSMPSPNNPTNPNSDGGWTPDASGQFTDYYSLQTFKPPVWYLQFYWAWGFKTPSFFQIPTIPGVNDGSIPQIAGPAIPLMIKTKNPATAFQNCGDFSTQGLYLSQSYVAVNREADPASPPGCPAQLGSY